MRYPPIDNELFRSNRKNLAKFLKPDSLAIIHSADPLRLSGDGVLGYRQDSNFFYLTGINQEGSVLLLAPGLIDGGEMLLVKETNEQIAIWEGEKHSKKDAAQISGINNTKWLSELDNLIERFTSQVDHLYVFDDRETPQCPTSKNVRIGSELKAKYPNLETHDLSPFMTSLRMIKSSREVELIQEAGKITKNGFDKVMKVIRPGIWEYEIEAEFISEFVKLKSRGFAYNPIIASGQSACILHYEENNRQFRSGDLVLMDIGAEYANYKADVTRTFPVDGKFTARQKEVYQAVLDIKNAATKMLRPGLTLKQYNTHIGEIMEEALIKLGLLSVKEVKEQNPEKPLYKQYYMHGTSHHLGLDVHDISNREAPIAAGMVLTVEPGIYIKEEGIGIRLEDDILVGEETSLNLTPNIPIEIEEVEFLMNS